MTHFTLTDERVLQLLEQLTAHTGESAEAALRAALEQRLATLSGYEVRKHVGEADANARAAEILAWLEKEVWSQLPEDVRGHAPSKEEQRNLLF